MNDRELKNILYNLYVLCTFEKEEKLNESKLKSLMISSFSQTYESIRNKEELIERIKTHYKAQFEKKSLSTNKTISFKIGEIRKTNIPTSEFELNFIFSNEEKNVLINVIENGKELFVITIKN